MDKNIVEILCAKDENAAKNAAAQLIKEGNIETFEALCEKMDYLFDFVRENVYKRLDFAINKDNFRQIIKFFEVYSSYFDDFFSTVLSKYSDENLKKEMIDILQNGTDSQKAYAASYFIKKPYSEAEKILNNNLNTDFEPLFLNCASALGKINSLGVFTEYKKNLESDDEFVKLKAVKFLVSYGNKNVIEPLIYAMEKSNMPENIAGEIVNLVSPMELLKNDFENGASLFNNLINGLGEILPLENIFYYEIYDGLNFLAENISLPEAVLLIYNSKIKFDILTENDEYIFDLDKNTKNEIFEIKNFLSSQKVKAEEKKELLKDFITEDSPYLSTILGIIKEEKIKDFTDNICLLTKSSNETVICESVSALAETGELNRINKDSLNIKNKNIKAIIDRIFS